MTKRRLIPFGRPLKRGSRGREVIAVKRGLARAGHGPAKLRGLTPILGPFTVRHLKAFQKAAGITPVTGNYGPKTHAKLARHFDDYAVWLYNGEAVDAETKQRRAIVAAMTVLYNNRTAVHYTQTAKRMQGVRERLTPPRFPIWEDCSSSSTWAYFVAGAADPNGLDFNGTGYTGTLCQHGRAVTLEQAQPGDLVFYGNGAPWGHVAVYIGGGRVISHGSEPGPYLLPIDYRSDRGEIRSYL